MARYETIRRRYWILFGLQAILVLLLLVAVDAAPPWANTPAIVLLWASAFVGLAAYQLYNFRCPLCGGFLVRQRWGPIGLHNCPRCGARLT